MIYLQKNNKRTNKRKIKAVLGIAVFLVVAWLLLWVAPNSFGTLIKNTGVPIWSGRDFLNNQSHIISGFISSRKSIIAENDLLKSKILENQAKMMAYDSLVTEHQKLLESYNRKDSSKRIISSVLLRPPQTPYDILLLDAGSRDGIAPGDVVYDVNGTVLGTVSEVSKTSSKASLFSEAGKETQAIIERGNLAINMIGKGGGSFEVRVPQETDIAKGDNVILPTLHLSIIGIVADVESNVASAFKQVLIQNPVNISRLRFVEIEAQL